MTTIIDLSVSSILNLSEDDEPIDNIIDFFGDDDDETPITSDILDLLSSDILDLSADDYDNGSTPTPVPTVTGLPTEDEHPITSNTLDLSGETSDEDDNPIPPTPLPNAASTLKRTTNPSDGTQAYPVKRPKAAVAFCAPEYSKAKARHQPASFDLDEEDIDMLKHYRSPSLPPPPVEPQRQISAASTRP
ncbi:hypothetical protein BDV98DRAFT_593475 [Pterulicium gracile]|uniref:Uncharacterized protein n=1 Tax=Pterulicium gracile TaxID=1884261 RepID=A0A5C3QHT4_9AGAR|nr:hypothetical protein BDV98DRAFT_593475 [Pterula gracilis]